jgi:hypothetical protein
MTKKIILIAGILIVVAGLFLVLKNVSFAPVVNDKSTSTPVTVDKVKIDPNISEQTLPFSNNPKDVAWALFQKYLAYNKDQNIEGVRSTVYKVAAVCNDPKTLIDCKARMGAAYSYGSALKKEDFTNIWDDEKQMILSTDFKVSEDDVSISRTRSIIFFVKDGAGGLRMLSFSPSKGAIVDKDTTAPRQELNDRLIIYTEDQDQDGIADYQEQCIGAAPGEVCVKTDPKLRDTNGNGLWDGVEALINSMK